MTFKNLTNACSLITLKLTVCVGPPESVTIYLASDDIATAINPLSHMSKAVCTGILNNRNGKTNSFNLVIIQSRMCTCLDSSVDRALGFQNPNSVCSNMLC